MAATFDSKKSVLIVDDDPDLRLLVKRILENIGIIVYESEDVEEALATALDKVPNLIILDIRLEDDTGFSLLEKLQGVDLLDKISIVMLSSMTSKNAIATSKKFDVDGYIIKPVNNNKLISQMKKILREKTFEPLMLNTDESDYKDLEITVSGEIMKVNEVSCILRSKVKFSHQDSLGLRFPYIYNQGVKTAHYYIYSNSRDYQPGLYDTVLQIAALKDEHLRIIRKMQTRKV